MLDGTGKLIESGWAPHPTYAVKPSEIGHVLFGVKELSFLRYKQFELHLFQSQTDVLFFFWGNMGSFAGSVSLIHYNIATKKMLVDENVITDFRELFPLSDDVNFFTVKDFSCSQKGLSINFSDSEHSDHFERHFKIKSEKLNFEGEFTYVKAKKDEGHFKVEQIVENDPRYFLIGYKEYGMEVKGKGKIGDYELSFDKTNKSMALFDTGRGVFKYKTSWIWVGFQHFLADGRRIAINIGAGIKETEQSQSPEDFMILDGKTFNLQPVVIHSPARDRYHQYQKWSFDTVKNDEVKSPGPLHLYLDFECESQLDAGENFFVVKSRLLQCFGRFNGWVTDEQNRRIEIVDAFGISEMHYMQL